MLGKKCQKRWGKKATNVDKSVKKFSKSDTNDKKCQKHQNVEKKLQKMLKKSAKNNKKWDTNVDKSRIFNFWTWEDNNLHSRREDITKVKGSRVPERTNASL